LPLVAALTPASYEISLVNEYVEDVDFDAPCDVVALSAMTPQAPRAYQIAATFRARGVPVVMGGFHASLRQEEAQQHVDSVVVGEAETSWPLLIRDFESGKLAPVYKSDNLADMSNIPTPRYDLINGKHYALKARPVQTTRGCPRNCDFCNVRQFFGDSYRSRPVEDVVRDIKAAKTPFIFFIDDNMMARRRYCMELFEALKPLGLFWGSQCNISVAEDEELLKKAAEAGCFALFVGIESINPASLDSAGKSFNDVSKYPEAFARLRHYGIQPMLSFILGLDGDGPDTFDRTYEFLMAQKIPFAYFFIITPGPGTKMFNDWQRQGRLKTTDWNHYGGDEVIFTPHAMDEETLQREFWVMLRKFYSWRSISRRILFPIRLNLKYLATLKYNLLHHASVRRGVHPLRG